MSRGAEGGERAGSPPEDDTVRPAGPGSRSGALPLGVRNRLAELILDAFDDAEARETLEAIGAFCAGTAGALGTHAAARLGALGWFHTDQAGEVRLLGAYRAHREALCQRAQAALRMLAVEDSAGSGGGLPALLGRASRLANAGLHFEVHELLEPAWMRADGATRLGLQGLIQIAVAFHHAAAGNRGGAMALLEEGLDKVDAAAPALPIETSGWLRELRAVLAEWRAGSVPGAAVPWPCPGGRARCGGGGSIRGEDA